MSPVNKIDIAAFDSLVQQGYLTRRRHPVFDLYVLNYTPRTAYGKAWTPETSIARGLVTRPDGGIVLRPFQKFFNLTEINYDDIPRREARIVYEKLDGSLILFGLVDGELIVCTRGSFESDQAYAARQILADLNIRPALQQGVTYLAELIGPNNRIVVAYPEDKLVLLGAIETSTGREIEAADIDLSLEKVRTYDTSADLIGLLDEDRPNHEGYVVKFVPSNFRVKLKHSEYVRLHRALTQVTPRRIWESVSNGDDLGAVLMGTPPEYQAWVRGIEDQIANDYDAILDQSAKDFEVAKKAARRAFAERAQTLRYPSVLFRMWDEKPLADLIWKLVRPQSGRAFCCDEG